MGGGGSQGFSWAYSRQPMVRTGSNLAFFVATLQLESNTGLNRFQYVSKLKARRSGFLFLLGCVRLVFLCPQNSLFF